MARRYVMVLILALVAVSLVGCGGTLDERISQLNRSATRIAGGDPDAGAEVVETATPEVTSTPEATPTPDTNRDLTLDPNASLVQAWGQTYGLESGAEFSIRADQYQVSEHIIQTLQVGGWSGTVRGGSVTVAVGQIRLDLALEATDGQFGAGTITFQPTLEPGGVIRLNPHGADFSGLLMPDNFTAALGDAVYAALTGAQTAELSNVTLNQIALDNGVMQVVGTVK